MLYAVPHDMNERRELDGSSHMIDPLYTISGFGVGLLVGMTGVGGIADDTAVDLAFRRYSSDRRWY